MMTFKQTLLALALGLGVAAQAHATTTNITDNAWHEFDVDVDQAGSANWEDYNDFSTLTFTFTLTEASYLRVVDAGFAGDTYNFVLNGNSYSTSAVPQTDYVSALNAGLDYDAAWADSANFSRSELLLTAGAYTLTGTLNQSILIDNAPLNATVGAVQIAAVPEESTFAMLLAGLGLMAFARRRA
jgi:hypothetical protein